MSEYPFTAVGIGWINGERRVVLTGTDSSGAFLPTFAARFLANQLIAAADEVDRRDGETKSA